ncbi:hypothetical protein L1887_58618 [Cichorium endivia]|nr:hypothetical protein L1887_58618 [Cichorium endivia]
MVAGLNAVARMRLGFCGRSDHVGRSGGGGGDTKLSFLGRSGASSPLWTLGRRGWMRSVAGRAASTWHVAHTLALPLVHAHAHDRLGWGKQRLQESPERMRDAGRIQKGDQHAQDQSKNEYETRSKTMSTSRSTE